MKRLFISLIILSFFSSIVNAKIYKETFESDTSYKKFEVLVGNWYRLKNNNNYVFVVDGKRWGNKIAGDIRPKIAKLFGEKYYAYMDNIKKYYYFPLAIYDIAPDSFKYEISVKIKPISGKVDQAGGIVFGMKDPGNYFVLRSNHLENNCVLFGYNNGKRYTIKWVQFKKRNTVANKKWHNLKVVINKNIMTGYFNNIKLMKIDFSKGIKGKRRKNRIKFYLSNGKVGLWAKADSKTYFDDFILKTY